MQETDCDVPQSQLEGSESCLLWACLGPSEL